MGLIVTMFSSFTVIKRFMRTQASWPCFSEPFQKALQSRQKGSFVGLVCHGGLLPFRTAGF